MPGVSYHCGAFPHCRCLRAVNREIINTGHEDSVKQPSGVHRCVPENTQRIPLYTIFIFKGRCLKSRKIPYSIFHFRALDNRKTGKRPCSHSVVSLAVFNIISLSFCLIGDHPFRLSGCFFIISHCTPWLRDTRSATPLL